MRIILTRHGETIGNIEGILQGQNQGKLSIEGKKQAQKLGKRLKTEKIDVIYSSDLKRASDTAKAVHKYHTNTPLIHTEKLRERDFGKLNGIKASTIGYSKEKPIPSSFFINKVKKYDLESNPDLQKRAKDFIDYLYKKHKKETVLVVSHAGFARALFSAIKGRKRLDGSSKMLRNTAVSIFEIDEDRKHKIILHNCTKHLE
ncbi:MAG: histidine phosphatase family protein [archaeon]|jgi:broad specificity phosphatase PhoE